MILKEIVDKTTQFFKEKKIESARLESELLISSALGIRRIELYLKFEQPLKEEEIEKCREMVRRRVKGEPVAYILGQKDFYNLSFQVDERVLIPRPETESLVEAAVFWLKSHKKESYQVLDLGAGSGCIGLSIAKNVPESVVTLIEASSGALEVIEKNRGQLGLLANTKPICSRVQDYDFPKGQWDIILANPPYISEDDLAVEENVKKFEPHSALFAGNRGLLEIQEWSAKTAQSLRAPGVMIFEIGMTQGPAAQKHFESLGSFDKVSIRKDLSGLDRFVVGEKNSLEVN